jgi:hypothetical protein
LCFRGSNHQPKRMFWNWFVGKLSKSDRITNTCDTKNCIRISHMKTSRRKTNDRNNEKMTTNHEISTIGETRDRKWTERNGHAN